METLVDGRQQLVQEIKTAGSALSVASPGAGETIRTLSELGMNAKDIEQKREVIGYLARYASTPITSDVMRSLQTGYYSTQLEMNQATAVGDIALVALSSFDTRFRRDAINQISRVLQSPIIEREVPDDKVPGGMLGTYKLGITFETQTDPDGSVHTIRIPGPEYNTHRAAVNAIDAIARQSSKPEDISTVDLAVDTLQRYIDTESQRAGYMGNMTNKYAKEEATKRIEYLKELKEKLKS